MKTVWDSVTGEDTQSRTTFYATIAGLLAFGFLFSGILASSTMSWTPTLGAFLLVGLVLPIGGILLAVFGRQNPILGITGLLMLFGGIGAIMGPFIAQVSANDPSIVSRAAFSTVATATIMGFTGVRFPDFYKSIGGTLFVALLALVAVSILQLFFPVLGAFGIIDFCVVGLFSLYIGYDIYRATKVDATFANAVDIVMSLYLDMMNIFTAIMSILDGDFLGFGSRD